MIIAYVGTPGSGKSYEAIKKILDNLKMGRVVITNIDGLNLDTSREHIKVKTGLSDLQLFNQLHFLSTEQALLFWLHAEKFPGALVVLDEVHKLFPNRSWQKETNVKFTEWSSTHRHGGYDLLLITQDLAKIDAHERSLIEWTYFYRKINHFGKMVKNRYRRHIYDSDDHKGKPLSSETLTYDKTIFPCYSSYDSATVKELGIQKTVNMLKSPIFFAIPCLIIFCGYALSKSSWIHGDLFGVGGIEKRLVEQKEGKSKASPVPGSVSSEKSPESVAVGLPTNVLLTYKLSDGSLHVSNELNWVPPPGLSIVNQQSYSVKFRDPAEKTVASNSQNLK